MIYPDHSSGWKFVWDFYIRRILRSDFHDISVSGLDMLPGNQSVFCIGNHISWWDGFFAWYLNRTRFHRKFHILMLEDQLKTRKPMTKVGAFSIQPGTKDAIESLKFSAELLSKPGNILFFFPQGAIHSQHETSIHFGKGAEWILERTTEPVSVIFSAMFTDYSHHRKPTLSIYLKQDHDGSAGLNIRYQAFYDYCRQTQINRFRAT